MNDADFEATVRYRRGMDIQPIIDGMVADGIEAEAAKAAVRKVQARLTAADRKRGMANLTFGLLILAIGGGVTFWTYTNWGDVFVVAYGALIVGPALCFIGLRQIIKAGKDSKVARMGLGY
ncbi:hypothetical protein [Brevundimonas sp. FT23028]|uniref:hypothetical protein n=1 Tax=Brevundimonas sp. FT23028 TaxID=3393748 RepID=UPI003B585A7C